MSTRANGRYSLPMPPRNLCRCLVVPADGSVIITGTGGSEDPYAISAPGSGAGTRYFDRTSIIQGSVGYPKPPADYSNSTFYGTADPGSISDYTLREFDGWMRPARDMPITLVDIGRTAEVATGSVATLTIPGTIALNDVIVVSVGANGGATVPPTGGWGLLAEAAVDGAVSQMFYKVLSPSDGLTVHTFSGLTAPYGLYWMIFRGVDPVLTQDVIGLGSIAESASSLSFNAINASTALSLIIEGVTASTTDTDDLLPPSGFALLNSSTGVGTAHRVAIKIAGLAGTSGTTTWTDGSGDTRNFAGALAVLRPALTLTEHVWLGGKWVRVGDRQRRVAVRAGNGVDTQITVSHGLMTTSVMVQVYNVSTGQTVTPTNVVRSSLNTVDLSFSSVQSLGVYEVVVMGV